MNHVRSGVALAALNPVLQRISASHYKARFPRSATTQETTSATRALEGENLCAK